MDLSEDVAAVGPVAVFLEADLGMFTKKWNGTEECEVTKVGHQLRADKSESEPKPPLYSSSGRAVSREWLNSLILYFPYQH